MNIFSVQIANVIFFFFNFRARDAIKKIKVDMIIIIIILHGTKQLFPSIDVSMIIIKKNMNGNLVTELQTVLANFKKKFTFFSLLNLLTAVGLGHAVQ